MDPFHLDYPFADFGIGFPLLCALTIAAMFLYFASKVYGRLRSIGSLLFGGLSILILLFAVLWLLAYLSH